MDRGIREQVLYRSLSADPADLDPHLIIGLPDINVASSLFEGLVAEDPVDLHPVPGVAERWEISADGLTYIFHLRANARWSNGEPVTAQDFVASVRRVLTASLAARNATMLYPVYNAEAFHKGALADFDQVGITALDTHTLRIRLERPAPYFLSLLTQPVWYPVHLPTLEKNGSPYKAGNRWVRPETFVGNGPFVLKTWNPGTLILVEKSPTYWDAATVRLNAIRFLPASTVDAEERAFRGGQLHVTEALPVAKIDKYRSDQSAVLRISPFLDTYFYRLNVTRPFLNEPKVRRALSLALDRATLVQSVLRGQQQPAASLTPPNCAPGYTPPADAVSDPAAARALLREAGYEGGKGLPAFELFINNSLNHQVIAEAVQAMWRRELGIEVRVVNMEQSSLLDLRRNLGYQLMRADWAADYLDDPAAFLRVFTSDSSNNNTGWKNDTYDSLIRQADLTAEPARRFELLRQAESILLHDAPIIPLYHLTTVRLVHPSVHGWYPTLLDHHPYKHVWLEN